MDDKQAQIYALMGKIMAEIGHVGKDSKNEQQGFKYRSIDAYPGYVVTDNGIIISLNYRGLGRPGALKPRIVNGYQLVTLCNDVNKWQVSVHRLVASAFLGPAPVGYVVNHLNGNRVDNRIENIEWTTSSGNLLHAYRTGLLKISEHHKSVARNLGFDKRKLTMDEANEIRRLFNTGEHTKASLSLTFGLNRHGISRIIKNESYLEIRP